MTTDFQTFWDAYALKRDRIAAERAWKKLTSKDRKAAIDGIDRYKKDCEKRGISRMYAQGYINHRRWEDEEDSETADAQQSAAQEKPAPAKKAVRIGDDLTESDKQSFTAMKEDLLKAWSRHRDEQNHRQLLQLLDDLQLLSVDDVKRAVRFTSRESAFNRDFVVPWFWDSLDFDSIVSIHFHNYRWGTAL